ncbi:MAG: rRNA adenine N-6-methyltransferase family protein [Brumimicrobium sp.]
MSKKKYFLKEFFKEKKTVGAVSPSSKHLGKKMLQNINFENVKVIVELGPGTGVFTRMILNKLPEDAKLLVFELHDAFYEKLSKEYKEDSRVIIVNDSAENISKHLSAYNLTEVDAVISSLPLANFNKKLISSILNQSYSCLKKNGLYVQFQYSLNSHRVIKSTFSNIRINFTPRNLPPAFVYTCIKK